MLKYIKSIKERLKLGYCLCLIMVKIKKNYVLK